MISEAKEIIAAMKRDLASLKKAKKQGEESFKKSFNKEAGSLLKNFLELRIKNRQIFLVKISAF